MAHKQAGGKSLMIQRKWPSLGIPRLYRSSGTDKVGTKKRIEAMLDTLAKAAKGGDEGAKHVLTRLYLAGGDLMGMLAIYDGEPGGIEALKQHAPTQKNDRSIDRPNFDYWLRGLDIKPQTAESYRHQHTGILRHAAGRRYMSDLPAIMKDYRQAVLDSGKGRRAYNYAMTIARAWAKEKAGAQAKAYLDLLTIKRLKIEPKPARARARWSPRFVRNVMAKVPPEIGKAIWFQAMHGLNVKEMMVDGYEPEGAHGLHIKGEKVGTRDRIVPLVTPLLSSPFNPAKFKLEYKHYLRFLKLASAELGKEMKTHDLRRCYSRWMAQARVLQINIQVYMGHSVRTQTEEYQASDPDEELAEDGENFMSWVGVQLEREKAPPPETLTPIPPLGVARRKGAKVKKQAA